MSEQSFNLSFSENINIGDNNNQYSDGLEKKLVLLNNKRERLESELEKYKLSQENMLDKIQEQLQTIESYRNPINELQIIEQERNQLRDEIETLKEQSNSLKEQLKDVQKIQFDIEADISQLKEEMNEKDKELKVVMDEIEILKTSKNGQNNSDLSKLLKEQEDIYNDLTKRQSELENNIKELMNMNEELEKHCETTKNLLDNFNIKISQLKKEQTNRIEEFISIKRQSSLSSLSRSDLSLNSDSNKDFDKIEEIKVTQISSDKNSETRDQINELQKNIQSLKDDINEYKNIIEQLILENKSLKEEIDQITNLNESRKSLLESYKTQLEELKRSLEGHETKNQIEMENEKSEADTILDDIKKKNEDIKQIEEKIKALEEEKQTLSNKAQSLEEIINQLKEDINNKNEKIYDLNYDVERIKDEGKAFENQYQFIESQLLQLNTLIHSKDLQISKLEQELKHNEASQTKKNEIKNDDIQSIDTLKREINKMKLKVESNVHTLKSLRNEIEELKERKAGPRYIDGVSYGDDETESLLVNKKRNLPQKAGCCSSCCIM